MKALLALLIATYVFGVECKDMRTDKDTTKFCSAIAYIHVAERTDNYHANTNIHWTYTKGTSFEDVGRFMVEEGNKCFNECLQANKRY